jgi:hypothetical protein
MKLFSVLFFVLFLFQSGLAQDMNVVLKEAERLEAIPNEKAAFLKFKEVLKLHPANLYALTKCSELCSRIGAREKDKTVRDTYFATSVIYAKTSLRLYPNSDDANVAMAISVGRTVLLKSGREKITAVKEIKTYADKAIAANPNNFKAWHILGKWNYEVSNLNAIERAAAKIMYGGLPGASLSNSIACYEKAKNISPSFILNYLELARAYKRNGDISKAKTQLNYMMALKNQTEDDPRIKADAQSLLAAIK